MGENEDPGADRCIELHRLPAYSPEFMPMEGIWKTTRKLTTHNAFFVTPDQRDAKLTEILMRDCLDLAITT